MYNFFAFSAAIAIAVYMELTRARRARRRAVQTMIASVGR